MKQNPVMSAAPPWLEPLLNTPFFTICHTHGDAARSERNMYCLDCHCDAFCFYCRESQHKDHQVIQIRRSSYHDVVRVAEIEEALDISGVQTYVINSARVMFLNERPQPKAGKGGAYVCEICGRSLLDPFRFCSLGCKAHYPRSIIMEDCHPRFDFYHLGFAQYHYWNFLSFLPQLLLIYQLLELLDWQTSPMHLPVADIASSALCLLLCALKQ